MTRTWWTSFLAAWEMLVDISIPSWLRPNEADEKEHPLAVFICFPLVGAVIGVFCLIIVVLLRHLIGSTAATIISSAIITALLELIMSGKNSRAIISFVDQYTNRKTLEERLVTIDETYGNVSSISGQMSMLIIFLTRMFCIAALIYFQHPAWIVVALALAYAGQATLATSNEIESGQPYFDLHEDPNQRFYPWIAGGLVALIFVAPFFLQGVIAIGLAGVIIWQVKLFFDRRIEGVTGALIGVTGYLLETLLFVIGLATLVRH